MIGGRLSAPPTSVASSSALKAGRPVPAVAGPLAPTRPRRRPRAVRRCSGSAGLARPPAPS
eukprot:6415341-Alexandrium_andersonii.AAC.1